jgi:hypothetical protein
MPPLDRSSKNLRHVLDFKIFPEVPQGLYPRPLPFGLGGIVFWIDWRGLKMAPINPKMALSRVFGDLLFDVGDDVLYRR